MPPEARRALPVLALDLDDTLCPFVEGLSGHLQSAGRGEFTCRDYVTYNFSKVWQTSADASLSLVRNFLGDHSLGLDPLSGAVDAVRQLSLLSRVVVVTSREPQFRQVTEAWIQQHFGSLIEDIVLTGNQFSNSHRRSKGVACRRLGATHLIDDQIRHLSSARRHGISTILFGQYPWQHHTRLAYPRLTDWHEVHDGFLWGEWVYSSDLAPPGQVVLI